MNRPDDRVHEGGRSWQRPPQLFLVRETEVRAPIVPRLHVTRRRRRRDGTAFGFAVCAALFVGAVLMCLAMGWIR